MVNLLFTHSLHFFFKNFSLQHTCCYNYTNIPEYGINKGILIPFLSWSSRACCSFSSAPCRYSSVPPA